jgi:hypothetical protein
MKALSAISLAVALSGFLFSFAISFQAIGLSQGLTIGDAQLEEYRIQKGEDIISFSGKGMRPMIGSPAITETSASCSY